MTAPARARIAHTAQPRRLRFVAGVVLQVLVAALLTTNTRFAVLEDEVHMLDAATQPLSLTVGLFLKGEGEHEHPPLPDLLLHAWLQVSPDRLGWLRAPSVLCYALALLVLGMVAAELAGTPAFLALVIIGAVWPFGFHFARLAGWYSFALLLVSLLTYFYVRLVRTPIAGWWIAWLLAAIALLYTSYFGWALIACMFADLSWSHRDLIVRNRVAVAATPAILAAAFAPLWPIAIALARWRIGGTAIKSKLLNLAYTGFALFASESIAPWFLKFSVPIAAAIAIAIAVTLLVNTGFSRRLLVYCGSLLLLMGVAGILTTKRALFIAGWLLVPLATALVNAPRRLRVALAISLVVIAGIGWAGIVSRRYYAAPHFIEPWPQVAREVAPLVRGGAEVVAIHPSFFYYLSHELDPARSRYERSLPVDSSTLFDAGRWAELGRPTRPVTFLVESVAVPRGVELSAAEAWLDAHCRLQADRKLLRDPGYEVKERFFPRSGQRQWRIELRRYQCDTDSPSAAH